MPITGTIPQYRIVQELGEGAVGTVYLAEDLRLDRLVALRRIPTEIFGDSEERVSFLHDLSMIATLRHPNLCTIYDVDEVDGDFVLVNEYFEGPTLRKQLVADGPLALTEALDITLQVCWALDAAHRDGVVHGNVGTANMFVTSDGLVKLLDLGLTRWRHRPTQVGEGSVALAKRMKNSPRLSPHSDIGSIGNVLTQLLYIGSDEPVPNDEAERAAYYRADQIIFRATRQLSRSNRYESIANVISDLRLAQKELAIGKKVLQIHEVERLVYQVHGHLPDEEQTRVEGHVAACSFCQIFASFARNLQEGILASKQSAPDQVEACPDSALIIAMEAEELDERTAQHVRAHVVSCEHCSEEFLFLRRLGADENDRPD